MPDTLTWDAHHRYWAFISYSWTDKRQARALHRRFERFAIPRPIRPLLDEQVVSTRRLRPVFRDEEEMSAAGVLDERLEAAIDASASLVLLASKAAAASKYVDREVAQFVSSRGTERLVILAVDGQAGDSPTVPSALDDTGKEVLWVDCRGRRRLDRRGFVRVVAAVLGVDFDLLWRRHQRRQRKIMACWMVVVVALTGFVGWSLRQQHSALERAPERQRAVFEDYLAEHLAAENRELSQNLDPAELKFEVLRQEDLNNDGLLDYFVNNATPAYCGSGGCALEVYLTRSLGEYAVALQLLGSSMPMVRDGPGDTKDIVFNQYQVSREPLWSVYRLRDQAYNLAQYEFCDGVIFEMCEPTVITPVQPPNNVMVIPGTVVRERPSEDARAITTGAGAGGPDLSGLSNLDVLGVLPDGQWDLVQTWKGSAGFVRSQSVVK